jgi:hypothetical protein
MPGLSKLSVVAGGVAVTSPPSQPRGIISLSIREWPAERLVKKTWCAQLLNEKLQKI